VQPHKNYTAVYAEVLAPYVVRGVTPKLVELGVFRGESLAVWSQVLGASEVIGIDGSLAPFAHALSRLMDRGAFGAGVPAVVQKFGSDAAEHFGEESVDIFVDDGGHWPTTQLATFRAWWRKMRTNGTYIVEDVQSPQHGQAVIDGVRKENPLASTCALHNIIVVRWERSQREDKCGVGLR
jgi:hypothetical protein